MKAGVRLHDDVLLKSCLGLCVQGGAEGVWVRWDFDPPLGWENDSLVVCLSPSTKSELSFYWICHRESFLSVCLWQWGLLHSWLLCLWFPKGESHLFLASSLWSEEWVSSGCHKELLRTESGCPLGASVTRGSDCYTYWGAEHLSSIEDHRT